MNITAVQSLQNNGGIAGGNGILRNVRAHQGKCAYGRISPDPDALQNAAIKSDPHIFFYCDSAAFNVRGVVPMIGVDTMEIIIGDPALRQNTVAPYEDAFLTTKPRTVEKHFIADLNHSFRIVGVGGNQHGNHHIVSKDYPPRSTNFKLPIQKQIPANGNAPTEQPAP